MHRRIFILILFWIVTTLFFCPAAPILADESQQTDVEVALMGNILPLVQRGHIAMVTVNPQDEDGLAWVEPLLWKNSTHNQKYRILQGIGAFFSTHNKLKGTHLKGAAAMDITSKQILGLINLETGKITIKK